mgnify:CR=1 FL=1
MGKTREGGGRAHTQNGLQQVAGAMLHEVVYLCIVHWVWVVWCSIWEGVRLSNAWLHMQCGRCGC